jgi:hypothetical protein
MGVGAEGSGLWEMEKLRKSTWRGPEPEGALEDAESASAAREVSRGSGPREGGLLDLVFALAVDPPALSRLKGIGSESGDCSRSARVASRRRAILRPEGRGGRAMSSSGCVPDELGWGATGWGLNDSTRSQVSQSIRLRESAIHSRCFSTCFE